MEIGLIIITISVLAMLLSFAINLEIINSKNIIELVVYNTLDDKKPVERIRYSTLIDALNQKADLERKGKIVILTMTKRS